MSENLVETWTKKAIYFWESVASINNNGIEDIKDAVGDFLFLNHVPQEIQGEIIESIVDRFAV